ncbi:universal stress protein [Longispora sp. NPDC051575]|uniref:universal stress protein n=1 Tax=Longispora sp. NPDC051575 TaxID=3154943 RepID=UPI0034326598
MSNKHRLGVVVGVDGSAFADAALDVAADQAAARGLPLEIMHGFVLPTLNSSLMAVPYPPEFTMPPPEVAETLARAETRVERRHPGLDVDTHLIHTTPAAWLVERSAHAALVVVGSRGTGGFAGLMLGAVSGQVATHAACPVMVVRGETDRPATAPVLVGVDDREHSVAALEFAFAEADRRGAPLRALYVWHTVPEAGTGSGTQPGSTFIEAVETSERVLAEAMAGFAEKYPQVQVTRALSHDRNPAEILLEESALASLVVVGSRGRGEVVSLLLGSVGYTLIHHADCPVVIVHPVKTE